MKIDKLPFYWRLKEKGSANIVPDHAPFEFDFIESLQLIIQKRDPQTWEYLEKIYRAEYNIGFLQDGYEIAKSYGTDFMDFIQRSISQHGRKDGKILEVGCGGCTLLAQLKEQGFQVTGVDPSPLAMRSGKEKNITVYSEFFPTEKYTEKVDLIFHSDVQEHVPDAVAFLKAQKEQLTDNGLIIVSLPDCTEGVATGDLSMAMHQHLNYFDMESLANTMEAAGLNVLNVEVARYGGSLYICGQNKAGNSYIAKSGRKKFEDFMAKLNANIPAVTHEIGKALAQQGASVGFYVPLRTLPYVSVLGKYNGYRFFDDTNHWYRRAFDGTEVYIENFEDLKKKPVTDLYIMSLTFGDTIREKVQREIPGIKNIILLRDILKKKAG